MHRFVLILVFSCWPIATFAVGIGDEFAVGFGGVHWGVSLSELRHQFPGGHQFFSTMRAGRSYFIDIEDPLFGIAREGTFLTCGLDENDRVSVLDIEFPYAQRERLLEAIRSRFGPFIGPTQEGAVLKYKWPTDNGIALVVRATKEQKDGLLALSIANLRRTGAAPRPK